MASRNPVAVTGNLMADPEVFGEGDKGGVRFVVVENIGYQDRQAGRFVEDEPVFWPVTVWASALAENVRASLVKGARVTVLGRYRNNVWKDDQDQRRSRLELTADEVAVSLRFAEATIKRNPTRGGTAPQGGEPPF